MQLTDNQMAAIVFILMAFTISLYQLNNQFQQPGEITYSLKYPQTVVYINIIILFLSFMSIIGLVKLLQRISSK
ncbi:MAG: hypothetical protein R6U44_01945 [Archaeoglobaceae archaeon]